RGWTCRERAADTSDFACDPRRAVADLPHRQAPAIVIRGLHFAYRQGKEIFHAVDLALAGGAAYRLPRAHGAGKTTLPQLPVRAPAPGAGELTLGGEPYRPWRQGNRAIALATQNPDHQWCGATLRDDLARRRSAFARRVDPGLLADARME